MLVGLGPADKLSVGKRRSENAASLRLAQHHVEADSRPDPVLLDQQGCLLGPLLFSEAPENIEDCLGLGIGNGAHRPGVLVGIDVDVAERLKRGEHRAEGDLWRNGVAMRLDLRQFGRRELRRIAGNGRCVDARDGNRNRDLERQFHCNTPRRVRAL